MFRPLFSNCSVKKTEKCKFKILEIKFDSKIENPKGTRYAITKECIWCKWKFTYFEIIWKD